LNWQFDQGTKNEMCIHLSTFGILTLDIAAAQGDVALPATMQALQSERFFPKAQFTFGHVKIESVLAW